MFEITAVTNEATLVTLLVKKSTCPMMHASITKQIWRKVNYPEACRQELHYTAQRVTKQCELPPSAQSCQEDDTLE